MFIEVLCFKAILQVSEFMTLPSPIKVLVTDVQLVVESVEHHDNFVAFR